LALGAAALLAAVLVRLVLFPAEPELEHRDSSVESTTGASVLEPDRKSLGKTPQLPKPEFVSRTIFDGTSPKGWMLTNSRPLPRKHVQPDGLNPHGTGSYLVVSERKLGDFILDFDYKLSKGCNSGVFLRVGDLKYPVDTGIEVALDDTTGTDRHDPGAFYDLVAPSENAQKPAGQWNHMTITAAGPILAVSLNGRDVSRINLEEWTVPGKRPDGTDHQFTNVAIGKLPRSGYLGFPDHGSDCWFKNIVVKQPSDSAISPRRS
jgi:hypothetical protein